MQPAYIAQLEVPSGILPAGSITEHLFDPDSRRKVLKHHGRMSSHTAKFGSEYWYVRDDSEPQGPLAYAGVAKITPKGFEADTPFGYFNDVVVHPKEQGQGLGRALAHAALKFGPAPQDQPLALEGYAGSSVNGWFENEWGMVARGIDVEGLPVGPNLHVPQVRYVSEADLTVAGIVRNMEELHPELMGGEFVLL